MKGFLSQEATKIVDEAGREVVLKGVNLGGWLMMEGYILHSINFAARIFKKNFAKALGKKALDDFETDFHDNFIKEKDFKRIAQMKFNCIRLPFHYGLIESKPYVYSKEGLKYLDRAVAWAKKYKLWVILDLHAAPGAQNHDWHSDSLGKAGLWHNKEYQKRTFALWEFLADHFKDEKTIAGYDLLNESVIDDSRLLNAFYKTLIKRIRSVDKNHILFVEGNKWAMDLDCLDTFDDTNMALSIHSYQPLEFTFNFVPHLSYPLKHDGLAWNRGTLKKMLLAYKRIAQKRGLPVFVGEFGVNYRQGLFGEDAYLRDILLCFKEFGFHWTYWTYKAVKNNVFPDGIFSFMKNPPWVNRQGPFFGWDNYPQHWRKSRKQIIASWQTDNFTKNTHIADTLIHGAQ